jgi:hypothetical protein
MSTKRAGKASAGTSDSSDHAITNALLLTAAIGWGLSLLIQNGRLTWPPLPLLSSLTTLAGCLALVGPLILARSGGKEGGLGELVWLTGGLMVWLFDLAGVFQGQIKSINWATPLGNRTMGLAILAVFLAGWKCGLARRDWCWTNVTGWTLGLFWVGMALGSWFLTPSTSLFGLVSR